MLIHGMISAKSSRDLRRLEKNRKRSARYSAVQLDVSSCSEFEGRTAMRRAACHTILTAGMRQKWRVSTDVDRG